MGNGGNLTDTETDMIGGEAEVKAHPKTSHQIIVGVVAGEEAGTGNLPEAEVLIFTSCLCSPP